MKRSCALVVLGGLAGVAGCVAPPSGGVSSAMRTNGELRAASAAGEGRADGGGTAQAAPANEGPGGEPVRMGAVRVQEWAFSDFGMSVKTNFGVASGENVQWMEVSALEPGGSAVARGLAPGDRILAIERVPVTELNKSAMLAVLFQRKKGEQVRVLVMARGDPLPRFVVLVAGRR